MFSYLKKFDKCAASSNDRFLDYLLESPSMAFSLISSILIAAAVFYLVVIF